MRKQVQGDHGGQGLLYVLLTSLWLIHCLPSFAWAGKNWEEMAEQLGKIEELMSRECSL